MSRWPFPWPVGQPPSLRSSLHRELLLTARVGAQIGLGNDQVTALARGGSVTFSTEQLVSWFPRGDEHPDLPEDLNAAEFWVLTGDDTLTPAS